MKKQEETRVLVDKRKLRDAIDEKGYSKEALSLELGYNKSYLSVFLSDEKYKSLDIKDEKLVCLLLGCPIGSFVMQEAQNQNDSIPAILQNLMHEIVELQRDMKNVISQVTEVLASDKRILGKLENLEENQEKMYRKLNANTIQLEKIKEATEKMQNPEYDRAQEFLRDILRDGRVNSYDLLDAADKAGISRAKVMQARKDLGVEIDVTGYGKNQKSWWYMPKNDK